MAGNVLDKAGYACTLPALISNWREIWEDYPEFCLRAATDESAFRTFRKT